MAGLRDEQMSGGSIRALVQGANEGIGGSMRQLKVASAERGKLFISQIPCCCLFAGLLPETIAVPSASSARGKASAP